jgi:hypothetical protein
MDYIGFLISIPSDNGRSKGRLNVPILIVIAGGTTFKTKE